MSLSLASIPIAAGAGALGILSPCVWPLVPVVMSSAASGGRWGPWMLTVGLSLSFALAGTLLSFLLVSTGTDPEFFRYVAGSLLLLVAAALLVPRVGDWLSLRLSLLTGRFNPSGDGSSLFGQFGVGLLLGLVWLPCVGPTLGAAIALASVGQELSTAFAIMMAYGLWPGHWRGVAGGRPGVESGTETLATRRAQWRRPCQKTAGLDPRTAGHTGAHRLRQAT
jgi:cytochrome c-type biogenesis protein